jgi:hypothetical protein
MIAEEKSKSLAELDLEAQNHLLRNDIHLEGVLESDCGDNQQHNLEDQNRKNRFDQCLIGKGSIAINSEQTTL